MVKSKMKICNLLMLAIVITMICALSGCARSATRRELIQWFQENYTDAPMVVSSTPLIDGNNEIYEAYLENNPELKFYIKSECSYVMEHSVYTNRTNFYAIYGDYYFSEYQKSHSVQFAECRIDESPTTFSLNVYYANREELEKAFDELCNIQAYMDAQEFHVGAWHHIYFESPLCSPARFEFSLGSGVLDLTGIGNSEEIIRNKQKDLDCELAVWVSFFQLHTDWFTEEELTQAFAYRKSEEYDGDWKVYIGELAVCSGTKQLVFYPQIAAPTTYAISFQQLYQILSDIGWETLEGNKEQFSLTGADGVLHQFSCGWQNTGNEEQYNRECKWLMDGVSYNGFGFSSEGYISSDYTFQKLTGLYLKIAESK